MSTTQVRIALPIHLKEMLEAQASYYGLSVSSYIRQLIFEEIRSRETYPVRTPSKATLRAIKEGNKEYKQGKTKILPLDRLDEFMKNL